MTSHVMWQCMQDGLLWKNQWDMLRHLMFDHADLCNRLILDGHATGYDLILRLSKKVDVDDSAPNPKQAVLH
jgi:hypothetical protein